MSQNQAQSLMALIARAVESCDCDTCQESEKPCAMDCEIEEACDGCREARDYADDARFAIDMARGSA